MWDSCHSTTPRPLGVSQDHVRWTPSSCESSVGHETLNPLLESTRVGPENTQVWRGLSVQVLPMGTGRQGRGSRVPTFLHQRTRSVSVCRKCWSRVLGHHSHTRRREPTHFVGVRVGLNAAPPVSETENYATFSFQTPAQNFTSVSGNANGLSEKGVARGLGVR